MLLNNRARDLLDNYTAGMAQHFGTQNPGRYFSLNDPQETALRLAMLESVEFLNWITSLDVDQLSGQVVNVGASVLHTGRSETGRFVRQVGVDGNTYSLVETDSCAALRWDLLSVWANAGKEENEFYNLVQTFSTQAFAMDMLRIGFNGTHRAKTTDPIANPNGEDVNIGWHEIMKTMMDGKQIMTDPVVLDQAGDYKSLDAMASDLINAKIPAQFRNDPRLVVLVGADLVAAEQYRLFQAADRPTEKIAAQLLGNTIAGRQAISDIASGLTELQGKSARAWVFTASGDLPSTLLELVKGIPLQSSVYTAAMMLVGDNLDGIKGMIHDLEPDTGA
ncbi:phage major capsid protein, P2 family [Enterobacter kobei]|uniref:phage major capsid protein, P2 family n=1 Tax=Enterobacter kobei TaxID=208224 RepID=UPI003ED8C024